jgi:hypothetical protein
MIGSPMDFALERDIDDIDEEQDNALAQPQHPVELRVPFAVQPPPAGAPRARQPRRAAVVPRGDGAGKPRDDGAVEGDAVPGVWLLLVLWLAFVASLAVLLFKHGDGVMMVVGCVSANYGIVCSVLKLDKRDKHLMFWVVVGLAGIVFFTAVAAGATVNECSMCWGRLPVASQTASKNLIEHYTKLVYIYHKVWGTTSNVWKLTPEDKTADAHWSKCFDDYDKKWVPCKMLVAEDWVKEQLSCKDAVSKTK